MWKASQASAQALSTSIGPANAKAGSIASPIAGLTARKDRSRPDTRCAPIRMSPVIISIPLKRFSSAQARAMSLLLRVPHLEGSVRARASKYKLCSRTGGDGPSRGFQDGQHRHGAAEELESAAIGGNVLVVAGARAEKVAEFIVSPAEPGGRSRALEAPHGPVSAFDAAVILLQPVIQVATGPVPHTLAQLGPDRPGVAVVAVRRDPVRGDAGHRLGGAEERLRGSHVAVLAEQHVDQVPVS